MPEILRLGPRPGFGRTLSPDQLHRTLDRYAKLYCPVSDVFGQSYHWSLMQVEYATDLASRSAATLGPLYEQLVRQSVLNVKAEQVATFLSYKLADRGGRLIEVSPAYTARPVRRADCALKPVEGHRTKRPVEAGTILELAA